MHIPDLFIIKSDFSVRFLNGDNFIRIRQRQNDDFAGDLVETTAVIAPLLRRI